MRVVDIVSILIPVFAVIGLGYFAGWRKIFDGRQVEGFNEFVLGFALPAMIFASVLGTPRSVLLDDLSLFLAMTGVQVVFLGLGLAIGRWVFHRTLAESTILALLISVPTAAFMGTPILDDLFNAKSASLAISMYAITVSVVVLPIAIALLEWARRPADGTRSAGSLLGDVALQTVKKAIVWAPMLALALALAGVSLPSPFDASLDLIGETTSAVALFASGLILAQYRLNLGIEPTVLALIKDIAQPAAMLGIAIVLGITGTDRSEAVILTAMPSSVVAPMLAVRYGAYESDAASALIIGTVLSVVTLIAVVAWIG
jgi:malonate transporter and related proteins